MVAPGLTPVQPIEERYETDVVDAEWEMLRPYLEVRAKTGPQRTVDLRRVFTALRYKLRTGCQWRLLPTSFPKRSTVSYYLQKWTKSALLICINDLLRRRVRREGEGRANAEATAGVIDTQSVKSTEAGGPERGFDGGKLVSGRKRNLLVDTLGLLITAIVHAANVYDGAGAVRVLEATRQRGIRLKKLWADKTYRGSLKAWMLQHGLGDLEIVEREPGQRGFVVQPKRWVVERTHAWMGRSRQLSKEYDHNPRSSESWLYLASIRLLTRRLTKASSDGELA
jgi:putative transposase